MNRLDWDISIRKILLFLLGIIALTRPAHYFYMGGRRSYF